MTAALRDNPKLIAFLFWFTHPELGNEIVYHRGELSRDAELNPDLAELASAIRDRSPGRWDVSSKCGHTRSEQKGDSSIEVTCYRSGAELVHIARRKSI